MTMPELTNTSKMSGAAMASVTAATDQGPGVTVTAFLAAFFSDPIETIHFRAFLPKGKTPKICDQVDGEECQGHKVGASRRALLDNGSQRARLMALNRDHGVYFVVNAGGDKDAEITRYNAFFAEADNKPIEEQHRLLDACPLRPSIRVETRKSVHAYWLNEGQCDEDQWREVQARLISYFGADPKIKNPSRVMRVPHFDHITQDGERKQIECVVFDPSRRYTAAEMMAAFPPVPKKEKPRDSSAGANNGWAAGGGYATWDALRAELGRRIEAHESARRNAAGRIDCRGICHSGEGNTGLFYDPSTNQAHCNKGCDQAAILRAFGLPEAPDLSAGGSKKKTAAGSSNGAKQSAPGTDSDAGESAEGQAKEYEWGEPQPIPDGLLPVPQLPVALIPAAFRGWLHDVSTRLQVPLDFPAVPAIVAVASAIGNQVRIMPKAHDDWTITPNLWGAIVGRPGTMKSPAILEAIKPLNRLVADAKKEHEEALKAWKFEKEAAEIRRAAKRDEMKKAAKRGSSLEEFRDEMTGDAAKEPTERRYITNDATVEKYGELLNQNPNGLLIQRDELTGWLRSLDDEGRAKDRSFYLEAANGTGDYTYDRIGRGTLYIKSITTSIIGGIQPGPLQTYLRATLGFGEGDDGLIQRFQVMTYPDLPPDWTYVDRWPDSEARNTAFAVFKALANMPAGLPFERDDDAAAFMRFAPDAQKFFEEWLTDLMGNIRSGAFEHPAIESHFVKFGRLMPALALVFELVNAAAGAFEPFEPSVSMESAKLAAAWCQFLMAHAKRIYGLGIAATEIRARALAVHIQKSDVTPSLPEGFTARDIYLKHWAGLNTAELVAEPLEMLEYLGWIRGAFLSKGGRPTIAYQINPRVSEVRL